MRRGLQKNQKVRSISPWIERILARYRWTKKETEARLILGMAHAIYSFVMWRYKDNILIYFTILYSNV